MGNPFDITREEHERRLRMLDAATPDQILAAGRGADAWTRLASILEGRIKLPPKEVKTFARWSWSCVTCGVNPGTPCSEAQAKARASRHNGYNHNREPIAMAAPLQAVEKEVNAPPESAVDADAGSNASEG
jgi:hypothetical protein